jgi:hypothetical protein
MPPKIQRKVFLSKILDIEIQGGHLMPSAVEILACPMLLKEHPGNFEEMLSMTCRLCQRPTYLNSKNVKNSNQK